MKFIAYDQNNENVIDVNVLNQVDGYSLQYSISQFLIGSGYGGAIDDLKQKINLIKGYGKQAGLSIMWGANCGNAIWDNYPYIEMVTKNHEGTGNPLYNKFPLFYNEDYKAKIFDFLSWLALQLKDLFPHIAYLFVCGINRTTKEIRVPAQDFATTTDIPSAYAIAGHEWLDKGYTVAGTQKTCYDLIDLYDFAFPDTLKISALIVGKNGFPCVNNNNMVCEPGARPKITDGIIEYCKIVKNNGLMATALTDTAGTPDTFVNSGLPLYYQLDYAVYGKNPTAQQFEGAIINAQNHNGQLIEVINNNVRSFGSIIQKYR